MIDGLFRLLIHKGPALSKLWRLIKDLVLAGPHLVSLVTQVSKPPNSSLQDHFQKFLS